MKDQNPYGTCWSFAACGSLESCLLPGESRDFSEDNMVLTSGFNYPGAPYDAGGQIFMSTAYLVRWGGPVYESDDAYGDAYTPAGLTPRKHVQEVDWLPVRTSALDNDGIKTAVMDHGAVDVSMGWYGSSSGSSYYNATTKSYYYNGSSSTNHEVLVVGWDDDYAAANFATTPAGNGAFIVKNSWGTGWGSSGYFYVSYYDAKFGRATNPSAVFNGAEPTDNYAGIYQYDPLGDCAAVRVHQLHGVVRQRLHGRGDRVAERGRLLQPGPGDELRGLHGLQPRDQDAEHERHRGLHGVPHRDAADAGHGHGRPALHRGREGHVAGSGVPDRHRVPVRRLLQRRHRVDRPELRELERLELDRHRGTVRQHERLPQGIREGGRARRHHRHRPDRQHEPGPGQRPAGHLDHQRRRRRRPVQHLGGQPRPTAGTWARSSPPTAPRATRTASTSTCPPTPATASSSTTAPTSGDPWSIYGYVAGHGRRDAPPSTRSPSPPRRGTSSQAQGTGLPVTWTTNAAVDRPASSASGWSPRPTAGTAARSSPPTAPRATPTASTSTCPSTAGYRVFVYYRADQRRPLGHLRLRLGHGRRDAPAFSAITVTAPTGTSSQAQGSALPVTWTTNAAVDAGQFSIWVVSPANGWYVGKIVAADGTASYGDSVDLNVPVDAGYRIFVYYRATSGDPWSIYGYSPGTVDVTRRRFNAITVTAPTARSQAQGSGLPVTWTTNPASTAGQFSIWVVSPGERLVRRQDRRRRRHRQLLRQRRPQRARRRRLPRLRLLPRRRAATLEHLRLLGGDGRRGHGLQAPSRLRWQQPDLHVLSGDMRRRPRESAEHLLQFCRARSDHPAHERRRRCGD